MKLLLLLFKASVINLHTIIERDNDGLGEDLHFTLEYGVVL